MLELIENSAAWRAHPLVPSRSRRPPPKYIVWLSALPPLLLTSVAFAGTATLSWTGPTKNSDGSPLTDLKSYVVVTSFVDPNTTVRLSETTQMQRVATWKIRSGKEGDVRAWLEGLNSRIDEVRQIFLEETMRAQHAYIAGINGEHLLILVMEAEDFEVVHRSNSKSARAVVVEFRALAAECLHETNNLLPLFQFSTQ